MLLSILCVGIQHIEQTRDERIQAHAQFATTTKIYQPNRKSKAIAVLWIQIIIYLNSLH